MDQFPGLQSKDIVDYVVLYCRWKCTQPGQTGGDSA
jgi:hypothetical protein